MQNFGLIRQGTGQAVLQPIPTPRVREDCVLVRTVAVALNPTDWTCLDAVGNDGVLNGCDFAGIVEEVGRDVKNVKKGDRVAGFSHGANDLDPEMGAFARLVLSRGIVLQIPDEVSFEKAAVLPCGVLSAGMGLYHILGLPFPGAEKADDNEPILIYGGSTATGSIAIQLAKLSGKKVLTTASPKNFDMVKRKGADAVYDHRDPNIGKQIRKDTGGKIVNVLDTIAIESSASICADAIGPSGGHCCVTLPVESPRQDVKSTFFLGYDGGGVPYVLEGDHYPANPAAHAFAHRWMEQVSRLWNEDKIEPHPQRIGEQGLVGVIDGLQQLREQKVSGEKLVYRVEETPWPN